ncbi:MAG: baseplate J/gp47 family protein [Rhodobacter sp.]|nr:baseplate J/gp47 family protein [Rhodobacter sp.]
MTETASDFGTGLPDQVWKAKRSGRVESLPFSVETLDRAGIRRDWKLGDLETAGPDAPVFSLDERDGSIGFGNGVNGRAPEAGEALTVRYCVSDGARGNVASVTTWTVRGVSGPSWFNPAPAEHGSDAETMSQLQTRVRRELAQAPQCVTGADLIAAARGLRGFDADALVLPESASGPQAAGAVTTLMAWIVEPAGSSSDHEVWRVPSRAWLDELRARLRPQVPIGRSLDVVAPQPIRIGLSAELQLEPRADAAAVLLRCSDMLQRRLGLRSADMRDESLAAPATIALSMIRGWLRAEPGVKAVVTAALTLDGRVAGTTIHLRPRERCVPDIGPQSLRLAAAGREDAR